jgi:hypothetical protein
MSKEQLDDLNDLVSELKNSKSLTGLMVPQESKPSETVSESITEDNIDDFIYRKSSTLIQQGVDTIEAVKRSVISGGTAETIEAYSKLVSSVASSIEILNKINIQKRKEKAARELKQMDLDSSKKLLDKYDGNTTINQTNILVASREEIMKAILDKSESTTVKVEEVIDIVDPRDKDARR